MIVGVWTKKTDAPKTGVHARQIATQTRLARKPNNTEKARLMNSKEYPLLIILKTL